MNLKLVFINRIKVFFNANALLFSLLVSLIIGILLSVFFVTALYFSFLSNQNKRYELMDRNMFSAIEFFLASTQSSVHYDTTKTLKAPENENAIISLQRKMWGTYDIGIIKSIISNDTIQKIIMVAEKNDSILRKAMYLADEGRPILFAGKTIINGDCYLPKAGIKRSYIDGAYFTEKKLIEGDTLKSNSKVPTLDLEKMKKIKGLLNTISWISGSKITLASDFPFEATERSFTKTTLVYYSKDPIRLSRKNLSGNIIIVSDSTIELQEDNQLKDILVIAKKIIISSSTKGNFQAFAKDTLWIESNTKLNYPSVLGLIDNNGMERKALLKVEKGCVIYGTIFLHCEQAERSQAQIQIDENTMIYGKVHSDNFAEVRGTINGNLTCQRTLVHTSSATYENHLFNVIINPKALSKYFVQSMIYPDHKLGSKIVKYLD